MLRAVSNDKLDHPPLNSKAANEYIGRAEVIHQKLCDNRQLIRGLRIETTYTALSLAQALNAAERHQPYQINTFYQNNHMSCFCIQWDIFLNLVKAKLNLAKSLLRRDFPCSHRNILPLDLDMKRIMGDVRSLIQLTRFIFS